MTKQPVVGTIVIGILVTLMGLWALALAFDLAVVRDINPTHLLIGTLLALALVLVLAALWPRSKDKTETVRFSPVSVDQARDGITTGKDSIVADLRWIDPAAPVTVPIMTRGTVTVLVDPVMIMIRTSALDVDIATNLGLVWSARHGTQNVYASAGVASPSDAHVIVDIAASAVKVRSH